MAAALALAVVALAGHGGSAPPYARVTEPRAVIWAVGDGADGGDRARAVVGRISAGRVDRLLYLGDVYPSGTRSDFARNYATTYGPLAAKTAPTPGNHDWLNRSTGYRPYWRHALRHPIRDWYAFRAAASGAVRHRRGRWQMPTGSRRHAPRNGSFRRRRRRTR